MGIPIASRYLSSSVKAASVVRICSFSRSQYVNLIAGGIFSPWGHFKPPAPYPWGHFSTLHPWNAPSKALVDRCSACVF
jgi:hypothetical protein